MSEVQDAYNPSHIRAALQLFMPPTTVIELRALGVDRRGTVSGYFTDLDRCYEAATSLSGQAEGVYITMNPVDRELLARSNNRARPHARYTTGDTEVVRRRWAVIDIDPVRPRGISSTEEEHRTAHSRGIEVVSFLEEQGWGRPVIASSGNGTHLLYRYDAENSPQARDALSDFLRGLASRFSDQVALVDAAMFNASRIVRLYGTQARKGDQTTERPHRVSRFVEINRELRTLKVEDFRRVADDLLQGVATQARGQVVYPPSVPLPPRPRRAGLDTVNLDIVGWFQAHEHYGRLVSEDRGLHSVRCPWEDEHSSDPNAMDTDTVIFDGRDGRLPGFRCMHSHCTQRRVDEVLTLWTDAINFGARQRAGSDYSETDEGNVHRLIDRYGQHLRFCPEFGGWVVWAGRGKWEQAGNGTDIYEMIRDVIRQMTAEAMEVGDGTRRTALLNHVVKSQKWERMKAVYNAAAVKREVRARSDQFDANPYLLNTPNALIDLRTGEVKENIPDDYCTRQTAVIYNPSAVCPRFDQFLFEVFGGDETLVDFIWRAIGYSITGSVRDQVLFFLYGSGSNGKSTLLEILRQVMGDYISVAAPGLLIETRNDRHPTEIADLRGRRLVYSVETGEGKKLAEELVKRLTGADLLKGRFMRADFFSFMPTHKLWLSANHKPTIRGTDHAIWRRIPLIPFEVQFKDADQAEPGDAIKDPNLLEVLRHELPGILARAVRAAKDWYEDGLAWPEVIRAAVKDYQSEMDVLGAFLEECCQLGEDFSETSTDLYGAYRRWAESVGEFVHSQKKFSITLSERGLQRVKSSSVVFRGVRLLSVAETTCREPLMNVG